MGFVSKLFGGGASKLIDSVGSAIDKCTTSDEERLKLKNELEGIIKDHEVEMESIHQQEVKSKTALMMAEVNSNDKLIARCRPYLLLSGLVLIFVMILLTGIPSLFGYTVTFPEPTMSMIYTYLASWEGLIKVYIVGRSTEKVVGNENIKKALNKFTK